jgi:flagellar biosynthesis protein FlhF
MEMYVEQGLSRMDCELKIAEKYKRPFHILSEKKIRIGGILGFFSKPGIQVEFYFSPVLYRNPVWHGYGTPQIPWQVSDSQGRGGTLDFEEEKRKVLAAAGKKSEAAIENKKETSQQILDSLKEIKEIIGESGLSERREEHPAFKRVEELLKLNDFSEKYITNMLARMKKELPLDKLDDPDIVQDHLLEWIGESINIYREIEKPHKGRIMVLVGPTGVGKTTTIAKLAAIFGLGNSEIPAITVRMITIDAYRIGARAQLESYGNIMQIPVIYVDNKTDLRKELALYTEQTDLFLIDTIGKSQKDSAKLGEMKELRDGCGKGAQIHLVLSACTKTSDIEDILQQFEPFNYKSVILTKLDETNHIGNVISALAEKGKTITNITDGQMVQKKIKKARVIRFLINLDEFKVDREKFEKLVG